MEQAEIMNYVAFTISVFTLIVGVVNHKRIRSNCFGKRLEVSIDIDKTQPSPTEVKPSS